MRKAVVIAAAAGALALAPAAFGHAIVSPPLTMQPLPIHAQHLRMPF